MDASHHPSGKQACRGSHLGDRYLRPMHLGDVAKGWLRTRRESLMKLYVDTNGKQVTV